MTFAEQLTETMASNGVSQSELARRLGCHASQVNQLCGGKHSPTEATMTKAAAALGLLLCVRMLEQTDPGGCA